VHPIAYRVVTGAVLATVIFGFALMFVANASGTSQLMGTFFGFISLFACFSLVAKRPRTAMWMIVATMWSWLPFVVVANLGCKRRFEPPPHWTELASLAALRGLLLLLPVVAIVTLLAFVPRRDAMPDARVLR
jgi:hypothetical protein